MKTILEVLGESSVRAIIISFTTACVLRGMRVKSPGICHRAWTGVLMAMLCLPLLSIRVPRINIPVLPAASIPAVQKPPGLAAERQRAFTTPGIPVAEFAAPDVLTLLRSSTQSRLTSQTAPRVSIYQVAGYLYLAGFCILALRLLAGTLLSRRIVRAASQDGQILYSTQCIIPMTVGLFRARIFLPAESKDWDPDKLDAILVHEKEHMRRRDPLVEWLALLNRSLYWFHPLSWWLCSKLSGLAEQACDEAVLARGHDSGAYAEHLLDFARTVKRRGALITAWGSSLHGSKLAHRIRRILTSGKSPSISRARLAVVAFLCGIAILVPSVCELARAQATRLHTPVVLLPASNMASPHAATAAHQFNQSAPFTVESKPDSFKAPDQALYETGTEYLKTGQYIKARLAFQTLLNTYPDSKMASSNFQSSVTDEKPAQDAPSVEKNILPNQDLKAVLASKEAELRALEEYYRPTYPDIVRLKIEISNLKKAVNEDSALTDVAQFYAEKGNYGGAIYRLKNIIDYYHYFSLIGEVNRLYKALTAANEGVTLALQGRNLSPEQVSELETVAAQNPDDLRSQSHLLEYYFYNPQNDRSIAKKREQMILRLIQHYPKAAVLSVPFGQLEPSLQGYAEAESLWKEQLHNHPDDLQIIKNAGNSFMLGNLDLAISTFEHGKSIDPESIVWDMALAACYNLKTIRGQAK